jgi:predicted ester cyclase
MSSERNKQTVREIFERVMNGHDAEALAAYTSNEAVLGSGRGLLQAFPDLEADIRWIVAEDDMVVVYHGLRGTQQGPWIMIQEPSGRRVDTAMTLAFRFDDDGRIVDQWLGSNFIEMLAQLGWTFAPNEG